MMIGPKRHRVNVQQATETRSASGDVQPGWSDLALNVAASIDPLRGDERYQAHQTMGKVTHRIRVRWSTLFSGLTEKDRLTDTNSPPREFGIVAVINIGERNREFEFLCEEKYGTT